MTTELLYSAAINNFNESFSVIQNFGLGMVVSCILGYFISIIYKNYYGLTDLLYIQRHLPIRSRIFLFK